MDSLASLSTSGIATIAVGVVLVWFAWRLHKRHSKGRLELGGGSHLAMFTTNLNERAEQGKLEAVTGRDAEIERVIQILMRRTKNNPLLLGEPGVGKTAVVEGVVMRIVKGDVPEALLTKRILSLDVNAMVSDTKFRGELEGRMKRLLLELEHIADTTILFVDEIHLIAQLSGVEGSLGVADILKPALSRGEIRVIGATTLREYQKYIRPDQAFERRLQPVIINEPSPEVALTMLQELRPEYEAFHHVKITDEALESAVRLSAEKINHRFLPDKAIDVIDEASARVAIEAEREHLIPLGVVHAASAVSQKGVVDVEDIQSIIKDWASVQSSLS